MKNALKKLVQNGNLVNICHLLQIRCELISNIRDYCDDKHLIDKVTAIGLFLRKKNQLKADSTDFVFLLH